jgi:hypothetical protein
MARRSNDRQSVTSFSLVCSASLFQFLLAADSGSIYDPPPTLSYSWDPDQSVPAHHRTNPMFPSKSSGDYQTDSESQRQPSSFQHLHSVASYELGLHPADPHSTISLTSMSSQFNLASGASGHGAENGSVKGNGSLDEHRFGPGTCTERVSGQELWVYGGQGGFVVLTLPANLILTFLKNVHVLALPYHSTSFTTRDGNQIFSEQWPANRILGSR